MLSTEAGVVCGKEGKGLVLILLLLLLLLLLRVLLLLLTIEDEEAERDLKERVVVFVGRLCKQHYIIYVLQDYACSIAT